MLEELAEDVEVLLPPHPAVTREDWVDCVVVDGGSAYPPLNAVHRLRLGVEDLDERIAAVRRWFRGRDRREFTWWVGRSATPPDLGARLKERGAAPYPDEPLVTSMVLTEPPPRVEGVDVRRVETYDDYVAAQEIGWESTGFSEEQRADGRATLRERWDEYRNRADSAVYLAFQDGEPVARGALILLPFAGFLSGAGTLEHSRGRGAFRALVRARWDEAVRRGTPALIVGAGAMSRPILERLGFRAVADTEILLDRAMIEA